MRLRDCLAAAAQRLADAGVEAPMREARLLAAHALKVDPVVLVARLDEDPGADARAAFEGLVARRSAREPLSRIMGEREFWSLPFAIGPAVLDPRPDSETLIEALLRHRPDRQAPLRLLDLGTGSGCLLLTALSLYPRAWGLAVDLSEAALRVARDNARSLGLRQRVSLCRGDWASALAGGWDVVLCNPPYIDRTDIEGLAPEVRCHDPLEALDGGRDGLAAYGRLVPQVANVLAPGGLLLLELGQGQDAAVGPLLARDCFCARRRAIWPGGSGVWRRRGLPRRKRRLPGRGKKRLELRPIPSSLAWSGAGDGRLFLDGADKSRWQSD